MSLSVKFFLYTLFTLLTVAIKAQISLKGKFLTSQAKIGEPVEYSLTFKHHKDLEVFFPDSTYQYTPFELVSKKFFPTYTTDSISTDSVIYLLRTFELKEKIIFALPVFIITNEDTTKLYPEKDLLVINKIPFYENLPLSLLTETNQIPVKKRVNYPYLIAIAIGLFFMFFLLNKFFGKILLRRYKLFTIYREHIRFLQTFDSLIKTFNDTNDIRVVEKALIEWRSYLTKLIHKPIHTYTSTEIIMLFEDEELKKNLQVLDRSIYGGILSTEILQAMDFIRKFSTHQYRKVKNTIYVH